MVKVNIAQLPHGHDLPLPTYATSHSAGMDLMAAIDADITLQPMQRQLIPAGIAIALPDGYGRKSARARALPLKMG